MENEIIKEYTNGEITIVWKPRKCIHSGECTRALPNVYDYKARPWINIDNGSTEEIKNQIRKCPSRALSYYMNDPERKEEEITDEVTEGTSMEVLENGPLIVHGTIEVLDKEGNSETNNRITALCRCGASEKKPYCDGAHSKVGFKG